MVFEGPRMDKDESIDHKGNLVQAFHQGFGQRLVQGKKYNGETPSPIWYKLIIGSIGLGNEYALKLVFVSLISKANLFNIAKV